MSTAPGIPGWTDTTITNAGSPVTISHPVAWKFVRSDSVSLGPSAVVAYFTNAPTSNQCESHHLKNGTEIVCNGPVARLLAGQVLITVTAGYLIPLPTPRMKTNTVVDGHPALLGRMNDAQMGCPTGAGGSQTLNVDLTRAGNPKSHWRLFVTACIGDNGAGPGGTSPVAEVEQLLHSVTFPAVTQG